MAAGRSLLSLRLRCRLRRLPIRAAAAATVPAACAPNDGWLDMPRGWIPRCRLSRRGRLRVRRQCRPARRRKPRCTLN